MTHGDSQSGRPSTQALSPAKFPDIDTATPHQLLAKHVSCEQVQVRLHTVPRSVLTEPPGNPHRGALHPPARPPCVPGTKARLKVRAGSMQALGDVTWWLPSGPQKGMVWKDTGPIPLVLTQRITGQVLGSTDQRP